MIPCVGETSGYQGVRTVFLDRDGVLNRKAPEGEYVSRWEQCALLPGVPEALRLLREAGLPVYVVTNQRGVALGLYTREDVERLHAEISEELTRAGGRIDGFYYCPHDKSTCECRKPGTGLFEQARAAHREIEWSSSLMIGDSHSDIEAGNRLGMRTIFIDADPIHQKPGAATARAEANAVCHSLLEAVQRIVSTRVGSVL